MKRMTFTTSSTEEIIIEHYMKDYEQKHGKKCTKSYAINDLICMRGTLWIMRKSRENA